MADIRKTVIYGRQSKHKDRSIEQQLDVGRDRSEAEQWRVHAVYSDGVSASRHARKMRDDWPRLLDDVRAGRVDVVWLWESSRGDRRASSWLAFLEDCRDQRVQIYVETHSRLYDMDNPREWRTLAEDGTDNQYESEKTRLRVNRDTADRAREGLPHGALTYGYRRDYEVSRSGVRRYLRTVPDADTAPIVRGIFRRIADGEPVYRVANDLNGRVSPPRQASMWRRNTVRYIARNPAYLGRRVYRGEVIDTEREPWPPLVDRELFDRVQARLDDAQRPRRPDTRALHLLSGIARCGVCGGALYLQRHARGRPSYRCTDWHCVGRNAARLEGYVIPRAVAVMAKRQDLTADDDSDPELADAVREADDLRRRLDGLADDLAIDEVTLARRSRALRSRLADVDRRVKALRLPAALGRVDGPIADVWDGLDLALQRELIREAVTIHVYPVGARRGWRDDAVRLEER